MPKPISVQWASTYTKRKQSAEYLRLEESIVDNLQMLLPILAPLFSRHYCWRNCRKLGNFGYKTTHMLREINLMVFRKLFE
jgi:hypothetical protein